MADSILHFGGVRIRVVGSGNLRMTYKSLDSINTKEITPLVMSTTTAREPTRICNFNSQYGFLKIYTSDIDEYFTVNKVIEYVKPIYDSFAM